MVFGTFLARSAKKILRVFKGKVRFLALFRAKREKILGYPEGSQIGTPEKPPLVKSCSDFLLQPPKSPPLLRVDFVDKGGGFRYPFLLI